MADLSKVARPYAKAVFTLANESQALKHWSDDLSVLSLIAKDPLVVGAMKNPKFSKQKLMDLFLSVDAALNEPAKNLIRVLARFKRLACLPDIARLFEIYKAKAEQVISVEMTSAVELDANYQQLIREKLSKRLHCQIELACHTDPSLLGGAIVRAGDYVIDGSVKGRLQMLKESIVS